MSLTPQQEKFAQGVVSGMSQAEAYRTAYPKSVKWKDSAVHVAGAKMMAIGRVSERVAELQQSAAEIAVDEAVEIARENLRLAKSRISGIMHEDGRVKLPHELDPATEAAIKSFKIDEYGRIEYQFWDKNSALERASKILGMFKEDNKQKTEPINTLAAAVLGGVIGVIHNAESLDDDE
jgi:hypothetical protein